MIYNAVFYKLNTDTLTYNGCQITYSLIKEFESDQYSLANAQKWYYQSAGDLQIFTLGDFQIFTFTIKF